MLAGCGATSAIFTPLDERPPGADVITIELHDSEPEPSLAIHASPARTELSSARCSCHAPSTADRRKRRAPGRRKAVTP